MSLLDMTSWSRNSERFSGLKFCFPLGLNCTLILIGIRWIPSSKSVSFDSHLVKVFSVQCVLYKVGGLELQGTKLI